MARALMIQGTASHVGKSVLTAAFGRWLLELGDRGDHGLRVAPFKAQNMSLNSFVTLEGAEIARSQATQAAALGLEPVADMNPILLKPLNAACQVIVQGRSAGVMSIHEYYRFKTTAWQAITESYDRLRTKFDAIVLEGAGSPAEINLAEHDLVNMRMAEHAKARVILVADIERGGAFAQLIGTWELLRRKERARIIGFLLNKFRGDASLLESGLEYVRQRTGKPVLGVLSFDERVQLEEEDSLGIPGDAHGLQPVGVDGLVEVAVLRLPGISNFTDFHSLARLPGVSLRFVSSAGDLATADLLILPGTRTTVHALDWLNRTGVAKELHRLADKPDGPILLGLCGGFQLLGRSIRDPHGVESDRREAAGLGLLDAHTEFSPDKSLYRVEGEVLEPALVPQAVPLVGYEIHHGETRLGPDARPWLRLHRQPGEATLEDGAVRGDGRVLGTYVHGLFDDSRFAKATIDALRQRRGLPPIQAGEWQSQRQFLAGRFAYLADWLRRHCDLGPVADALDLS